MAALASGKVGAAGIDHFVNEALATDHPLTGFSHVVLTPHIGGATYDTEANHSLMVANDLERLFRGETDIRIAGKWFFEPNAQAVLVTTGDERGSRG